MYFVGKDTAIALVLNFASDESVFLLSTLDLPDWWSKSSSSITSVLLTRTETYCCRVCVLISDFSTKNNSLAMMLQSALLASVSSEARGNILKRPCKKQVSKEKKRSVNIDS